ncbi:hypothetical protein GGF37_006908 [Kickxella alabastrina]|nr:hypothetical protein GGF37_006908 [Kickxella alabastrina]
MRRYGRTGLAAALVVLLFAEHAFLAVRWLITRVMASWPGAYTRIVERSQAQSRRRWLERAPQLVRGMALDSNDANDPDPASDPGPDNGTGADAAGNWRAELEHGMQAIGDAFKTQ